MPGVNVPVVIDSNFMKGKNRSFLPKSYTTPVHHAGRDFCKVRSLSYAFSVSLAIVSMCNGGRGLVQSGRVFVLIRRAAYFGRLQSTTTADCA